MTHSSRPQHRDERNPRFRKGGSSSRSGLRLFVLTTASSVLICLLAVVVAHRVSSANHRCAAAVASTFAQECRAHSASFGLYFYPWMLRVAAQCDLVAYHNGGRYTHFVAASTPPAVCSR